MTKHIQRPVHAHDAEHHRSWELLHKPLFKLQGFLRDQILWVPTLRCLTSGVGFSWHVALLWPCGVFFCTCAYWHFRA